MADWQSVDSVIFFFTCIISAGLDICVVPINTIQHTNSQLHNSHSAVDTATYYTTLRIHCLPREIIEVVFFPVCSSHSAQNESGLKTAEESYGEDNSNGISML